MRSVRIIKDLQLGREGFFTRKLNATLTKVRPTFLTSRTIRPSEITECTRAIVCRLLGFSDIDTISAQQQRTFDNGNYVHKRYLKSYLPKMGCLAKVTDEHGKEHDFIDYPIENKEYWIKGKPDAVIINDEDGLLYVFELKSIKQELFIELRQPDWSYVAQVQLYMFLTNIPRTIVFYENKNDQSPKEFIILRDEPLLNTLLAKIKTIQQYVLNYDITKALPECDCTYKRCNKFVIPGEINE